MHINRLGRMLSPRRWRLAFRHFRHPLRSLLALCFVDGRARSLELRGGSRITLRREEKAVWDLLLDGGDAADLSGDGLVLLRRGGTTYPLRVGTSDWWVYDEVVLKDEYGVLALGDDVSTVLDLGANVGYFTLLVAAPGRRVFSVEPAAATFAMLQRSLALNGMDPAAALCRAVTREGGGTMRLFYSPGRSSTTSCEPREEHGAVVEEEVATASLEEVVERSGFDVVDLLKIDVEGGEYEILAGAPEALLRRVRTLAMELHLWSERASAAASQTLARLEALGFSVEERSANPELGTRNVICRRT